jgi:hypothetical protein
MTIEEGTGDEFLLTYINIQKIRGAKPDDDLPTRVMPGGNA